MRAAVVMSFLSLSFAAAAGAKARKIFPVPSFAEASRFTPQALTTFGAIYFSYLFEPYSAS